MEGQKEEQQLKEVEKQQIRMRSMEIAVNFAKRNGESIDIIKEANRIFEYVIEGKIS